MDDIIKNLNKPIDISDVEFRVQSINKGGYAIIVPYKNVRVDMNRLDEVCGALWQDKYELIGDELYCSIGIKIGSEWVWRQDVGIESSAEKVKGRASDSFKRAGFRWGIGRELYNYPLIKIKLNNNEFKIVGDKVKQTYNLDINAWSWSVVIDNGKVTSLKAIYNNELRYSYVGSGAEKDIKRLPNLTSEMFEKSKKLNKSQIQRVLKEYRMGAAQRAELTKIKDNLK